ncbi:MAG TPA: alpha/beta hydrolase [Syntrophales bacterium]|nr:alpha/beta hydrolase [Syntrophales bacterium]
MIGTYYWDEHSWEVPVIVFHEINGVNISCWVGSEDFSDGKKSLVFVHGSGGDHRIWIKQYTKLKDEFNIAVIDLPGHGQSEGAGEQNVSLYVEWAKMLLDSFALQKPVLIGHSLGAAISLVFAIQYGERLSGVVPVGGGVRMPVNEMILKGLKTEPEFVIGIIAKFSVSKENRERLMRTVIDGLSCTSPEVLYGDLLACDRLDITGQVSRIRIPALVLCGTDDKMTPPALSQFLGDNIPGARMSLIENAGHMVMLENADAFNRLLKDFVESLPVI